jgi:Domain of unknown function (DUF6702)
MLKIIILPFVLFFHPIHVTLTTIDQAQGVDTIKVHFRMYYDDFLRDYELYDRKSNIGNTFVSQSFPTELASNYFNDKVQIYVNNKLLIGKILTVNIQDNEIFMNLWYKSDIYPKKIKVINKILTRLYSDQTNMVFIKLNKNEQAIRLTPEHDKELCSFNK